MIASVQSWWTRNIGPAGQEYQRAGDGTGQVRNRAWLGAGLGAAAGATAAAIDVARDETSTVMVPHQVPRPEVGPGPELSLGTDYERLMQEVRGRSSGAASADLSIRYLGHLRDIAPGSSAAGLSGLYNTLENHFPKDADVRSALNLVAAYVEKHPGARPFEAAALLIDEAGEGTNGFSRASAAFIRKYEISPENLNQTVLSPETQHSAMLGRFGMMGGVALGAAGGALLGAGLGAAVAVLGKALNSEEKA